MALPKKNKIYANLNPNKIFNDRVDELMKFTDDKTDFLPPSITLEDLENAFYSFIENGELRLVVNGEVTPVIFYPNERWADIEKTWKYLDSDNNLKTNFITVRRTETLRGTHAITKYGVPDRLKFSTYRVPKFDGFSYYEEVYRIPQPIPVDLVYSVKLVSKYKSVINQFDTLVLKAFNDRQTYVMVNGHYLPIIEEGNSDDSRTDDVLGERIYLKTYTFKFVAYLQNEDEFEVWTTYKRTVIETNIDE